jgi:hypothetical protein
MLWYQALSGRSDAAIRVNTFHELTKKHLQDAPVTGPSGRSDLAIRVNSFTGTYKKIPSGCLGNRPFRVF